MLDSIRAIYIIINIQNEEIETWIHDRFKQEKIRVEFNDYSRAAIRGHRTECVEKRKQDRISEIYIHARKGIKN